MMFLTTNFTAEEIQAVCYRKLTEAEVELYRDTCVRILQPARRVFGAFKITSALRRPGQITASGNRSAHEFAGTLDFVPLNAAPEAVANWIATYCAGAFGEMILEYPDNGEKTMHIHVTRYGIGGKSEYRKEVPGSAAAGQKEFALAMSDAPASTAGAAPATAGIGIGAAILLGARLLLG